MPFHKMKVSEIVSLYEYLVSQAIKKTQAGKTEEAFKLIAEAANIAYLLNWRYQDERLELALASLSKQLFQAYTAHAESDIEDRIVLFDSWGLDARGLTLQYIRALKKYNCQILFLCENLNEKSSQKIREELQSYAKSQVVFLKKDYTRCNKTQDIYKSILDFRPNKIFMHMSPWAVEAIAALYAFPNVHKYQINLTDHAFWLGTGCSNTIIEFRNYGNIISQQQRGFNKKSIKVNPYYPIIDDSEKQPLPEKNDGELVILTGGAYYKMYGRNGYFFDLIIKLLENHQRTTIWIAGNGNDTIIKQRLHFYINSGRVKLIGNRKDINNAFQASDIYLSTYPLCGGLMAQLAVANKKAILAYTSKDLPTNFLEDIVGTSSPRITTTEISEFMQVADDLIEYPERRQALAEKSYLSMHRREEFEQRTLAILNNQPGLYVNDQTIKIDYDAIVDFYIEVETRFQDNLAKRVLHNLNADTIMRFPILIFKSAVHYLYFLIKNRIHN